MRHFYRILLLLACSSSASGADYSGLWFSCMPEWQTRSPHVLLEVSRDGATYTWIEEWGVPYAANGKGTVRNGKLVLRGCKSYRGEIEQGCDDDAPPIYRILDKSFYNQRKGSLRKALRHSTWIRTNGKSWEKLAAQCVELQETLAEQVGKQKK